MKTTTPSKDKLHKIIAWALMVGLLFLRLPFLGVIAFFAIPIWLEPVYQIGTYLLTACLIWWERDRLADFNIDKLALIIIILAKPIQSLVSIPLGLTESPLAFPNLPSFAFWIISLGLFLALWLSHAALPKLSRVSFKWFVVGTLVGFIMLLVLAYPMSFEFDKSQLFNRTKILTLFSQAPLSFFYQLGYAAVSEEPLFRAFLWGYLHKAGWKTVWIWLFQAGLFMLSHIYGIIRAPFYFWLLTPVFALIAGGLVWRTKTISSSLAAHATTNALGSVIYFTVASLRM
ncbi:MAG: CPBP family intramembrane metalloprotease [Anaerolineales bacterium]|nr:CPBP family intramembrane metalloprotease [Anaerolineales bacterium]